MTKMERNRDRETERGQRDEGVRREEEKGLQPFKNCIICLPHSTHTQERTHAYMHECVCACISATALMWSSEDNLLNLILFY